MHSIATNVPLGLDQAQAVIRAALADQGFGVLTETDVELPEEVLRDLRKRLRRVAGQVQGIERMLDEGRECRDVVTQISAANRALEQAGFRLVSAGLTYCLAHPEEAKADGYPIDEVEKMFMRLA